METGEPLYDIPACTELATITGKRVVRYLISTKKAGNFVVVTIKDVPSVS